MQNVERAKQDLLSALQVLDAHLLTRTFLLTERITLADIIVFSTLIHAFQVCNVGCVKQIHLSALQLCYKCCAGCIGSSSILK